MKKFISAVVFLLAVCISTQAFAKKEVLDHGALEPRQFEMEANLSDGQQVSIIVVCPGTEEGQAMSAISKSMSHILELDRELFSEDGVESRMNSMKTNQAIQISTEAFNFISKAVEIASLTNGWFDISAPSVRGPFNPRDWRSIVLDKNALTVSFKKAGMKVDLKRLSFGYYTDIATTSLASSGFKNISAQAGQVKRFTGKDIFTPWAVQIEYGEGKKSNARRAFTYNVSDISAATITPDGLGAGLIDPKNKRQVAGQTVQNVTTFAKEATLASAYGLVVYTFGQKYGFKFIESHPEVQGIIVDGAGNIQVSSGLAENSFEVFHSAPVENSGKDKGPNDLKQKEKEESYE